jgi:hypothetical protein
LTLILITVIAAVAGGWAAWSSASGGGDPLVVGLAVYGLAAGLLGRVFGGPAIATTARSLLLLAGGVLGVLAVVLLGRVGVGLTLASR